MNQTHHPIWSIVRVLIFMITLVTVLYLCATKFDASELKVIMYMFVAAASGEAALGVMKNIFGKKE